MSLLDESGYGKAHGDLAIRMDAPTANRILLALEQFDQSGGLEPALDDLRQAIRVALVTKSSGDTDSAPSSAE